MNREDFICLDGDMDGEDIETKMEEHDGSEDEQCHSLQMHPLHNPLVLTRMFDLCSQKELAKFRQVSKLWNQLSLQSWRSSITLKFSQYSLTTAAEENFFWKIPNNPLTAPVDPIILQQSRECSLLTLMQTFIDYVQRPEHDCTMKPFQKFYLGEWQIGERDPTIGQFFQICGPSIATLELNRCFFNDITIFRNVLFKLCPNLGTLIIKDCRFGWSFDLPVEPPRWKTPKDFNPHKCLKHLEMDLDHEPLPLTWMEIYSNYPSLEKLKVYNIGMDVLESMLLSIKLLRKLDSRKLVLKHMDLLSASLYAQDSIPVPICQLLRQLELPLESLTFDAGVSTLPGILHDILQCHTSTLKNLNIYRGPLSVPLQNFPFGLQFDHLSEMIFSDRLCESLAFLKFVPNLNKLTICDVEDRVPLLSTDIVKYTVPKDMEGVKMTKCTMLRFDYMISEEETERLIQYLPNVQDLQMPLNNQQFRLVCKHWRNLRKIDVLGNWLTDEGITGLHTQTMRKINGLEYCDASSSQGSNPNLKGPKLSPAKIDPPIHPNITDLNSLCKFTMNNDYILPTRLLDCSAYCGFLKLPSLQILQLSSQMSDEATDALMANIPDCNVVRLRFKVEQDYYWD